MWTDIQSLSIGLVSDFIGSYSRNPIVIHRTIMTSLQYWDEYYLALEEKSMEYPSNPRVVPQPGIPSDFIGCLDLIRFNRIQYRI